jgi:hypothetical protein
MNGPILESISAISGTGTIINNGGIIVQGSGASIAPGADINVTGTSNIYLSGGLTNAGTLTFASGVTNAISGGIMTNTGMLRAINGTRLNVTCAFDSTGGNVVAQDNAIIDFTGLPAILGTWSTTTGGQILINGIAVDTTVFAPPEGMTFSGRTDWNNVTLSGTFTISPGAVVRIAGNLTLTPGTVINMGSGTFTNASMQFVGFSPQSILGSGEIIGAGTTASTPSISGSRQLTIGPNITIRTSTSGISVSAFDAPLINLGTLRSTVSGLRLLAQGMPFNNQGSVTIANGLATNFLGPVNSGTITIGPGTSVSIPVGQTFSQTSTGTLTFQINGPSPTINAARMPVQGSFTAGGRIRVQYVSYNPPALCRPAVMLVERLSAGASITGNFTQFTLPTSSAPIAPRVRRSDVGIYFASSIPADVAALGGNPVPDGQFSADDLIFYIDRFISGDVQLADIASLGGALGPDSQITADDIIAFLNSAFAGCP